eukprot:Colp12_sorted_trinity150504_noHs@30374
MSSEVFENSEFEFQNLVVKIQKKITSQIPNYSGEQKKQAIKNAQRELEEADDILAQMDMELKNQPAQFRAKLQARLRNYQNQYANLQRDLKAVASGGTPRDDLISSSSASQYSNVEGEQRQRLLVNTERLNQSNARLENAQRVALESEQIGADILAELGEQRETIQRTQDHLRGVDADLNKSQRVLRGISRRIATNKCLCALIILLLLGIIGVIVYLKVSGHI